MPEFKIKLLDDQKYIVRYEYNKERETTKIIIKDGGRIFFVDGEYDEKIIKGVLEIFPNKKKLEETENGQLRVLLDLKKLFSSPVKKV